MRGRGRTGGAVPGLIGLLAAALLAPGGVAAATLGFNLLAPSASSVAYSDFVTFRGNYTCVNDGVSNCSTSAQNQTATFSLRPSGGSSFTNVTTVTTSVLFTSNLAGCVTTCTVAFQVTWKAGRTGTTTIPPGVYDVGLTTTIGPGQPVLLSGLTIVAEGTTTTYGGATSGLGGNPLSLSATVRDLDLGQLTGTGIFSPDTNLAGTGLVTFQLFDATNTIPVPGVAPVAANLTSFGATSGTPAPTLTPPASGGTFWVRSTFAGNSFYTTSSDADLITVTPSNTAPQLVLPSSPVVAEATSRSGASVAFSVAATDAEDDPEPTPTCSPVSGATFPLGDTTVGCSVTDIGGSTTTGSFVVRVVDTTDPTAAVSTTESAGASGWYNAASNDGTPGVTVDAAGSDLVGVTSLACTDNSADVGPLSPLGDAFAVGDGSHVVDCVAGDAAGNHDAASLLLDVDQTAPAITGSAAPAPEGTGWWNASTGAPTVSFTCADATSGVASCTPPTSVGEGAGQTVTGTATDVAGNVATRTVSGLDVDLTAPGSISFVGGGLADGGQYPYLFVPDGPTSCTASDAVAGLASCSVTGYSADLGTHVLTATASDVAGNTSTATLTYEVLGWTLVGFMKPIDMSGFNSLRAGGAAQLKFEVFAGSIELTSPSVILGLDERQITCDAAPAPTSSPPPKKNQPTVGSVGGHFSLRWEAPNLAGTCWVVTLRTTDGSSLSAAFKLR